MCALCMLSIIYGAIASAQEEQASAGFVFVNRQEVCFPSDHFVFMFKLNSKFWDISYKNIVKNWELVPTEWNKLKRENETLTKEDSIVLSAYLAVDNAKRSLEEKMKEIIMTLPTLESRNIAIPHLMITDLKKHYVWNDTFKLGPSQPKFYGKQIQFNINDNLDPDAFLIDYFKKAKGDQLLRDDSNRSMIIDVLQNLENNINNMVNKAEDLQHSLVALGENIFPLNLAMTDDLAEIIQTIRKLDNEYVGTWKSDLEKISSDPITYVTSNNGNYYIHIILLYTLNKNRFTVQSLHTLPQAYKEYDGDEVWRIYKPPNTKFLVNEFQKWTVDSMAYECLPTKEIEDCHTCFWLQTPNEPLDDCSMAIYKNESIEQYCPYRDTKTPISTAVQTGQAEWVYASKSNPVIKAKCEGKLEESLIMPKAGTLKLAEDCNYDLSNGPFMKVVPFIPFHHLRIKFGQLLTSHPNPAHPMRDHFAEYWEVYVMGVISLIPTTTAVILLYLRRKLASGVGMMPSTPQQPLNLIQKPLSTHRLNRRNYSSHSNHYSPSAPVVYHQVLDHNPTPKREAPYYVARRAPTLTLEELF